MNEIDFRENKRKDAELNKSEIMKIIDQLPPNSNVTFTGGEVFLKKGIDEIIRKTAPKHTVTIATNGLLLVKHVGLVLEAGVKAIGVSLDGPPEVHNQIRRVPRAYDQLADGFRTIMRSRQDSLPHINVNGVILPDNYSRLHEVPAILKDFGIYSCSFQILDLSLKRSGISPNGCASFDTNPLLDIQPIDPGHLKTSLLNLLRAGWEHHIDLRFMPALSVDEIVAYYQGRFDLNLWTCRLPWDTMRISPYGDVYPCLNLLVGNVRRNKLREIWNNDTYRGFRRDLKRASLFPACVGCCKMQRR
jgi:MoaA/NifB/PqqE/SkfB family radical SAM enzyme